MSRSPIATTSIIGSGLHHHAASVRWPHGGSPSSSSSTCARGSAYISLSVGVSSHPLSFLLPLPSPRSACFPSAPMALPVSGQRGFQDSTHKMAAVRPKLAVAPSGAVRAWSTVDSTAPSASTSFLDMRSSSPAGPSAPGPSAATTAKGKVTSHTACTAQGSFQTDARVGRQQRRLSLMSRKCGGEWLS